MAKFELADFILLQHQHHKQLQREQQQLQRELEGEELHILLATSRGLGFRFRI